MASALHDDTSIVTAEVRIFQHACQIFHLFRRAASLVGILGADVRIVSVVDLRIVPCPKPIDEVISLWVVLVFRQASIFAEADLVVFGSFGIAVFLPVDQFLHDGFGIIHVVARKVLALVISVVVDQFLSRQIPGIVNTPRIKVLLRECSTPTSEEVLSRAGILTVPHLVKRQRVCGRKPIVGIQFMVGLDGLLVRESFDRELRLRIVGKICRVFLVDIFGRLKIEIGCARVDLSIGLIDPELEAIACDEILLAATNGLFANDLASTKSGMNERHPILPRGSYLLGRKVPNTTGVKRLSRRSEAGPMRRGDRRDRNQNAPRRASRSGEGCG